MANLIDTDAKVITPGNYGYGHPTIVAFDSKQVDTKETVLLLHLNGSDGATSTVDSSLRGHNITFGGNAQLDDAQKKFGTTSCLFDGAGDYLSSPTSEDWMIGNGYFAVDLWVKHANLSKYQEYVTHYYDSNNYWRLDITNGNVLRFTLRNGGTNRIDVSGGTISDTNLHHIALCKVGNEYGIYLDGVQTMYVSSSYNSYEFGLMGTLYIGAWRSDYANMDGWLDEVRICQSNPFAASPNVGKTDTITVPTSEHSTDLVTTSRLFNGFINDLGDLEIHKSFDDGSTWTLDTTITPSTGIEFFNLCHRHTGSVDELFVLHSDGTQTYRVQKRTDGGSWSQVYNYGFANSSKNLLRYDRSNDRLLIYCRHYFGGQWGYQMKYSLDGGSTWSTGSAYSDSTVYGYDFDIKSDGSILASRENSDSVHYFSYTGAGISPYQYTGLGLGYKWRQLLINSSDNWLEIGYDSGTTKIKMAGYLTDEWTVGIDNLKAGIDGDDNVYVFYTKTSDEKVYYRKYEGSWGSETLLVNAVNNKFNCEKHTLPSGTALNYIYYTA